MIRYFLYKLLKLYTPFISALMSAIHGVLYLREVETSYYVLSGEYSGYSLLFLAYVHVHSRRMCIWYKRCIYSLYSIKILSLLHYHKLIHVNFTDLFYSILVINIFALIFWCIFIVKRAFTKAFYLDRKY